MSAPKQPESPVVGAIKGLWGQTSKLTVTVASNVAEALGKSLGQNTPNKKSTVGSPNGLSAEWVGDVQTEYARPFTTGSPTKKSAAEADPAYLHLRQAVLQEHLRTANDLSSSFPHFSGRMQDAEQKLQTGTHV